MENKARIAELTAKIDKLYAEIQEIDRKPMPDNESFEEFYNKREPFYVEIRKYDRELRLLKTPTFSELSDYGDVMSLDEFIDACKTGMFIDSDGSGCYVKDGKESDIEIHPSDVMARSLRKDFDTIIWFNK